MPKHIKKTAMALLVLALMRTFWEGIVLYVF